MTAAHTNAPPTHDRRAKVTGFVPVGNRRDKD